MKKSTLDFIYIKFSLFYSPLKFKNLKYSQFLLIQSTTPQPHLAVLVQLISLQFLKASSALGGLGYSH